MARRTAKNTSVAAMRRVAWLERTAAMSEGRVERSATFTPKRGHGSYRRPSPDRTRYLTRED
jgi:hypothetical protein